MLGVLFGVLLTLLAVDTASGQNQQLLRTVAGIMSLAVTVFYLVVTVYRLQDVGWSKWLGLVVLTPYVAIAFVILLMIVKGKGVEPHEAEQADTHRT